MKGGRVPGTAATAGVFVANRTGRCPDCGARMRIVRRGLAVMHHGPNCKVAAPDTIMAELVNVDQLPWLDHLEKSSGM